MGGREGVRRRNESKESVEVPSVCLLPLLYPLVFA